MPLKLATVLINGDRPLTAAAFVADFRARWPDLPAPSEVEEDGLTLSCQIGFDDVIVGRMPAPIPWTDLEGPCATSILWKNATEQVRAHTEHYIVTVNAELGPIPLSALLTRVVASVLAATDGAIGVYWMDATLLVPRDLFLEFADRVLPLGPPLAIWVDIRAGHTEGGGSAGFTSGLAALGLREIEVAHASEKPSELYERLQTLVEYVVAHPSAIQDGHTVGRNADEKIRVRFTASQYGHSGQVMALTWETPPKPWWKIWS